MDDLAVIGRIQLHIHGNQFVRAVAEPLDPESSDIEKFLLSFDAGEVGRGTGFVGTDRKHGIRQAQKADGDDDKPGESLSPAKLKCIERV